MASVYVKLSDKHEMVSLAIEHPKTHAMHTYDLASGMSSNLNESPQKAEFYSNGHWVKLNNMQTSPMIQFIKGFIGGTVSKNEMGKGTAIGRKDSSPYGRAARILKLGLPDNVSVSSHVFMCWSKGDLMSYVLKISKETSSITDLPK